jgi:NAD(P)-dependent dehydrogenase (short-subunit alcohol dehydrogenase family)
MQDFRGKIAVVTGGGSGMGRELTRQLTAEGCQVAICDISPGHMAETVRICAAENGARVVSHIADVSVEADLIAFRDHLAEAFGTDKIHLLFNNAGIYGAGSFITDPRADWERIFNICWGGVYYGLRVFMPMLLKAEAGHITNMSSVNGFWASLGPQAAHTAYSAAKFAIKGLTEGLITDLRLHAPHIKCSVVMPARVGTPISRHSVQIIAGGDPSELSEEERVKAQAWLAGAPTSAAQAAHIILTGVKEGRWRILVGEDAIRLDKHVRAEPEKAYDVDFYERFGPTVPAT